MLTHAYTYTYQRNLQRNAYVSNHDNNAILKPRSHWVLLWTNQRINWYQINKSSPFNNDVFVLTTLFSC